MDQERLRKCLERAANNVRSGALEASYGDYLSGVRLVIDCLVNEVRFVDDGHLYFPGDPLQWIALGKACVERLEELTRVLPRFSGTETDVSKLRAVILPEYEIYATEIAPVALRVPRSKVTSQRASSPVYVDLPLIPTSPLLILQHDCDQKLASAQQRLDTHRQLAAGKEAITQVSSAQRPLQQQQSYLALLRRLLEDVQISQNRKHNVELQITRATSKPFTDWDPRVLAHQLTLIDLDLFKRMECDKELRDSGWTRETRRQVAPCVSASVDFFNFTSHTMQFYILSSGDPDIRARCWRHVLAVAQRLSDLASFNMLGAVVSALNSAAIQRLDQTHSRISKALKLQLTQLAEQVDAQSNFAVLRARLSKRLLPCVPFLGMFLHDLVYIDTAHSPQYEMQRRETVEQIQFFQNSVYDSGSVSSDISAQHWLLTQPFHSEEDLYAISIEREPPKANDSAPSRSGTQSIMQKPIRIAAIEVHSPPQKLNDDVKEESTAPLPNGVPEEKSWQPENEPDAWPTYEKERLFSNVPLPPATPVHWNEPNPTPSIIQAPPSDLDESGPHWNTSTAKDDDFDSLMARFQSLNK